MSNDQGLGLADIAKLATKVQIDPEDPSKFVLVRGISAGQTLKLLQRFPNLIEKGLTGGGSVSIGDIFGAAPDAIAAVIAIGVGQPDNGEAEEQAAMLSLELQLDFLEAIAKMTFRNGFGPFVLRLKGLAAAVQSQGRSGAVPDMKSPQG